MKLLAVDLDGTCLDHEDVLRPSVLAALKKAADAGVTVAVSTGMLRSSTAVPVSRSKIAAPLDVMHQRTKPLSRSAAGMPRRFRPVETATVTPASAAFFSAARTLGRRTSV